MNAVIGYLWKRFSKSKGLAHLFWMVLLVFASAIYWCGLDQVKSFFTGGPQQRASEVRSYPRPGYEDNALRRPDYRGYPENQTAEPVPVRKPAFGSPHPGHEERRDGWHH